ncbi:hypothetical protein SAMN04487965_2740 [Microbulbifer donghaiensis]|uniref:Uncharacterized protein n=1 Tax=Microbulbifer donghaiensis TaxID=494016 RepID=A0A1M5EMG8_9GAMM|nr:hypothetical protein [Microbulbifer donghaiensis]SHF80344.1 hypothetical protein SAMN04487965_2740 [Microbulbifer donghaiensis]
MELIVFVILIVAVLVLPLKMAAAMMGARNTGVFHCLFALLLAVIVQRIVGGMIPGVSENLGVLLTIPLAAVAYMLVLGTGFLKAIVIALLQGLIMIAAMMLFAGVFAAV